MPKCEERQGGRPRDVRHEGNPRTRTDSASEATALRAEYRWVLQWKQLIPRFSMYPGLVPSAVWTSRSGMPAKPSGDVKS